MPAKHGYMNVIMYERSTYETERSPPPGGIRFAAMLAAD